MGADDNLALVERILRQLVRHGFVTDVDKEKRMARVKFQGGDMTSGWLYVLQHYDADLHIEPDGEQHTHRVESAGSHSHPGSSVTIAADGEHTHAIQEDGEHDHPGSKADDKDAEITPDGNHAHQAETAGSHAHAGSSVAIAPDGEHTHTTSAAYVGEHLQEKHAHPRSYVTWWLPKVNDKVLVLYLPLLNSDGFILGRFG